MMFIRLSITYENKIAFGNFEEILRISLKSEVTPL